MKSLEAPSRTPATTSYSSFCNNTMLDIAQLCKTNCHSRNYFRLIEQHGTLNVQIYMNLNFIWLIFNANVNCNAFKVKHEKLEHNNQ